MSRRLFRCRECGTAYAQEFELCDVCGTKVESNNGLFELGVLILVCMLLMELYYSGRLMFMGVGAG